MKSLTKDYTLIENAEGLKRFTDENQHISWMGFDTEFIGEKRYNTLLCLIQISTENGYYLLDTLKLRDINIFLDFLQNPKILKITHAGENDYRLLKKQFDILPKNLFDVQLAAGFVGYKYPIAFQKIVEKEIGVHLSKGYTVSDWEARPMNEKQIKYALNDVIYLYDIWQSLSKRLTLYRRLDWVMKECSMLEEADYYYTDPYKEALTNSMILGLSPKEQVFLIRLYEWRRSEAKRKNHSKEMVLQSKLIAPIVRHMASGRGALKNHRRIPDHVLRNHWETFNKLWERPVSEAEKAVLQRLPSKVVENQQLETVLELLHLLLRYKCQQNKLSPDLVLNRTEFKKMKTDLNYFYEHLEHGWRKEFLGEEMINWLRNRDRLVIDMQADQFVIRLGDPITDEDI